MIPLVVITHGKIAQQLIATASVIVGKQEHIYFLEIGAVDAIEVLKKRLDEMVSQFSQMPLYRGTLIMTDMIGGSSCNICVPLINRYRVAIVSGVNLYMLISAIKNRESMTLEELKNKVLSDAIKSITDVCELFAK